MRLLLTIIIFFVLNSSKSQEGVPIYFDYLTENYYLVHPSMAGVNLVGGKLRMTARKQWFDQEKAPNLQTLSVDYRLTERSGLGTILFKDQNGFHSQIGAYFTYAHHISFNTKNSDQVPRPHNLRQWLKPAPCHTTSIL